MIVMREKIEYSMLLQNVSKTRAEVSWQRGPTQRWTTQMGMDLHKSLLLELACGEQPDGKVRKGITRLRSSEEEG